MNDFPEWYVRLVAAAAGTTPECIRVFDDRGRVELVFGSPEEFGQRSTPLTIGGPGWDA